RTVGAKQRQTSQGQVANRIQRLVAGAFVAEAQPFGIEQAVVVEHHRILKRGAARKTGAPEPRDVVHEAKSPGTGNLAAEAFGVEIEREILAADHGIGEVDLDLDAEP